MTAPIHIATVRKKIMIGTDIYQIHLSFNQNVAPSAGQFYMLILFGIGEAPFSVADVFPEKNEVVFAIRNVGNVTNKISQLKEGEQIGIKGPFGKPWPVPSHGKKNCLILAGGIGIIPMRLFIRQLIQKKNKFNKIYILYGAKEPRYFLFSEEFIKWQKEKHVFIKKTVDQPDGLWSGHIGSIVMLLNQIDFDPQQTIAYICGPEVMMHYCTLALQQKQMDASHIYLSIERNMQCGEGLCGHCMLGPYFVCKDGAVFSYDKIDPWLRVKAL